MRVLRRFYSLVSKTFPLLLAATSHAGVMSIGQDPSMFGHLDQTKVTSCTSDAGVNNSCGGTAAVNSFVYLQNKYPAIYGNDLIPQTPGNTPMQNLIDAADNVNCYMGCIGNGVPFDPDGKATGFFEGKKSYVESQAGGKTMYDSEYFGRPAGTPGALFPTYDFLFRALSAGADVELKLDYYQNDNGTLKALSAHYVTLYAMSFNPDDGTGTISFVDPAGGVNKAQLATKLSGDGKSIIVTGYGPANADFTFITGAAVENAAPEPSSLVLLGIAGMTAAIAVRKRPS